MPLQRSSVFFARVSERERERRIKSKDRGATRNACRRADPAHRKNGGERKKAEE